MDPTGQSLLNLLFNPGETICVSNNEYGFQSIPLKDALSGKVTLISPNENSPLRKVDSSKLTMVAINPIHGWRRDEFVTGFRSYLIELDFGTTKEQLGTIAHYGLPFSAQVFSGNKSVHTVITLDQDLPDEKTYRAIGNWIFNIFNMCDQNCKNPSRSTRIPGAYREPGKKQRLIKLNRRVTLKELMDWLKQYDHLRPRAKEKKVVPKGQADFSRLSPWCRVMLTQGVDFKNGRNATWYAIAYDLALAGFTEDGIIEILSERFEEERDFKEKEFLTTIGSAFKKVRESP
jgi:hypothetical protein